MNDYELAKQIFNCLSDGYDDKEYEEVIETALHNELSQIEDDNLIKVVLKELCARVEDLEEREEQHMKATGIVRRIDDLGRIVIPKEIRKQFKITDGDAIEIFIDLNKGGIFLKPYKPIED